MMLSGAAVAVLLMGTGPGTPPAAAALAGGCSGGGLDFATEPIGVAPAPVHATFDGTFGGCTGTPAAQAVFHGNFAGPGSCLGAIGQLAGTVRWSNGAVSTVSGPWRVPGGPGVPITNTLAITGGPGSGGRLMVDQGSVNGRAMMEPCLTGSIRKGSVPVSGLRFG